MPITVQSGVLDRHLCSHSRAAIDAYVIYTMSNGNVFENAHLGLPLSGVQAIATAAGRSQYSPDDVCSFLSANVPDLSGTPLTVAAPAS